MDNEHVKRLAQAFEPIPNQQFKDLAHSERAGLIDDAFRAIVDGMVSLDIAEESNGDLLATVMAGAKLKASILALLASLYLLGRADEAAQREPPVPGAFMDLIDRLKLD